MRSLVDLVATQAHELITMATDVTPCSISQEHKASSSGVVVPKRFTFGSPRPVPSEVGGEKYLLLPLS